MSFSSEVKQELAKQSGKSRHCQIAELAALVAFDGKRQQLIGDAGDVLDSENPLLQEKYGLLLAQLFHVNIEEIDTLPLERILETIKMWNQSLRCADITETVNGILLQQTCCRRAYIRGAFLAGGSISDPNKSYHFEIVCATPQQAEQLRTVISDFGMDAKVVERKKHHVVYLKEGAQIVDMLNIMEAHVALMNLENVRILKEMRNSVNRQVNCETANINKTGNKEYIFTRRHDPVINSIGFNITQGRLGNALYVTRKMANMYLQSNGLPINPQTWNYTKVDDEYKNRDNRMNNQLMVPGQTYWGTNGGRIDWSGDAAEIANASHRNFMPQTGTGYFPHKWCSERDGVPTGMEAYDFPVIRYAEVLLNYAEAVFERDGQISDEDLAISLNLTRKRINPEMPDLTNDFVTANNLDMRTEIRRERTIEFFDENFRIDDLKRWKTAEDEMPMNLTGVKWKDTDFESRWPDASFKDKDGEGCIIHEKGRNWHEKHYLLPLPTDQLKLNSNLKQNPGWNQ